VAVSSAGTPTSSAATATGSRFRRTASAVTMAVTVNIPAAIAVLVG
jgi:hypothetical protein